MKIPFIFSNIFAARADMTALKISGEFLLKVGKVVKHEKSFIDWKT